MTITKEELYYTYRKVKRELFFNKDTIYFQRILDFEDKLTDNIEQLHNQLNDVEQYALNIDLGENFYLIKKIKLKDKKTEIKCSVFDSNKENPINIERFSNEFNYPEKYQPDIDDIEFRAFGDLSIEFQIIAGLWLNKIGYNFEKDMPSNSYGNRLKEVKNITNSFYENHTYFKQYFKEYKKWQENLVDKVTNCDCSNEILVINTDFKNFFNSVDLVKLRSLIIAKDAENAHLTNLLFDLIERYNQESNNNGLPLNLLCSSSLANIYLIEFDNLILNEFNTIYYGRYVDDILIAINANDIFAKNILKKNNLFLNSLCEKIKSFTDDYSLKLNDQKSKFFLLNSKDKNKFKQLKEHLNNTSSEWRLIPSTEKYEDLSLNLHELFSENYTTSHLTNIKDSYDISTRRNYFIKEIANFEKTYFIINEDVWRKRLINFFNILDDIIFDLKNYETFQKYLPRLYGLLHQTNDQELIHKFTRRNSELLNYIDNQLSDSTKEKYKSFKHYLFKKAFEYKVYFTPLSNLTTSQNNILHKKVRLYFNSDLHLEPLTNSFYKYNEYQEYLINDGNKINLLFLNILLNEKEKIFIRENLNSLSCSKKITENNCDCEDKKCSEIYETLGFYFFTRKISLLELSVAFKNMLIDNEQNRKVFQGIAKKFYSKIDINNIENVNTFTNFDKTFNIKEIKVTNNDSKPKGKIVICNTHLLTEDNSVYNMLKKLPETDSTRIDRIINLVNEIIRCGEKIDYLVFHELAIPRNLYMRLAQSLSQANINLIAGLEYKIDESQASVDNQIVYMLKINNEYNESIALYQSKLRPAIHEGKELRDLIGYSMKGAFSDKLIINHNNFIFSGMICNDLINQNNRYFLRGEIDFLFVVAWNTDTGMYEHLVKTTSFDNHCYVLLCNNRRYGDSHIFVPYKEDYKRYLQRINGGKRDNFMISEIDLVELRKFQINVVSPEKPFKPLPTGYEMSEVRKKSLYSILKKN